MAEMTVAAVGTATAATTTAAARHSTRACADYSNSDYQEESFASHWSHSGLSYFSAMPLPNLVIKPELPVLCH
jgi:hypothetical protein